MTINPDNMNTGQRLRIAYYCIGIIVAYHLTTSFFYLQGTDFDESIVLNWGQRAIKEFKLYLYAPEYSKWEMLSSYFYGLNAFVSIRWTRTICSIIGLLELYLFFRFIKKQENQPQKRKINTSPNQIYLLLLALTCPWFFLYSKIMGPVHGVTVFFLLAILYLHRPVLLSIITTLGLFTYTPFRLFFPFFIFLKPKDKKTYLSICLTAIYSLSLIFLSNTPIKDFFTRGSYNFLNQEIPFFKNIISSIIFPFIFPINFYKKISPNFTADHIHESLMDALKLSPPLGFGLAILSLIGIGLILKKIYQQKSITKETHNQFFVWWLINIVFLSFMGPSLSRFILIIPSLFYFAYFAIEKLSKQKFFHKIIVLAIALNLISMINIHNFISSDQRTMSYYPTHISKILQFIKEKHPDVIDQNIIFFSGRTHHIYLFHSQFETVYRSPSPPYNSRVLQYLKQKNIDNNFIIILSTPYASDLYQENKRIYRAIKKQIQSKYPQQKLREIVLNNEKLGDYYHIN